jgi:hypothetical protein
MGNEVNMTIDWDQTVAKVKKIMGGKTKVPDIPPNVSKTMKEYEKTWSEFQKSRDATEDKLLAWQNAVSVFGNTVKQFSDKIEASDLGNDKNADDYKKKRAEAQKLFDQLFAEADKNNQANVKNAQELDKHMRSLASYKSPEPPNL